MTRRLFHSVLAINVLLLLALVALWLVGDVRWPAPAAQVPDPSTLAGRQLAMARADLSGLPQTLERPVFAATRRPPPEVSADTGEAVVEPDVLEGVAMIGVFDAGAAKYLMLKTDGKVIRLKAGEAFGPWTLRSLSDRSALFQHGHEQRKLELVHASAPANAKRTPALGAPARRPPGVVVAPPRSGQAETPPDAQSAE